MINKNLESNSANRVENEDIKENGIQGILSKENTNRILFNVSQKLFEAGVEMAKISGEMSAIYLEMGEKILEEIDFKDNKMSEDEIKSIMDDILALKGTI